MSRWITFVVAGTSALALSTVAAVTPAVDATSIFTGSIKGDRVGGSWCC